MSFLINWKIFLLFSFILPLLTLNTQFVFANNSQVYIENIDLKKQSIVIKFSGKASFQTVQIDDFQILIALKGILSNSALDESIKKSGIIKQISFDKMAGNVTALVVYTNKEVKSYSSKWLEDDNSLLIDFVKI